MSTSLFIIFPFAALTLCALVAPASGAGLDATCRTRSSYDFTVNASWIAFERTSAPMQRIEMNLSSLIAGGKPVALNARDRDRAVAFESILCNLIPRVKALAQRAVDISVAAIREEAGAASLRSAAAKTAPPGFGALVLLEGRG